MNLDAGVVQNIIELAPAPLSDYADNETDAEAPAPLSDDPDYEPDARAPAGLSDDSDSEQDDEDEAEAEDEDDDPQPEPTQDEIEAWMTPKRAREKELLLQGQYRKSGRLTKSNKAQRGISQKLREKNKKLNTRFKCERMRRIAAEKTMNDMIKMLEK